MSEMIEFSGNGHPYQGYLAPSAEGKGPGIIVIQEWWGLVGHITSVADRLAEAGFTALAPDFYHGVKAAEPDEAGSLMMALQVEDAARVIDGAVEFLLRHPAVDGDGIGVVWFCMGGKLAMFAAGLNPDIRACVNFYGIHPNVHPDYAKFNGPLLGFFAEHDDYASPEAVAELDATMNELGKSHEFHTFPGTHHAFFNDDRPTVFDPNAAEACWGRMTEFFREELALE